MQTTPFKLKLVNRLMLTESVLQLTLTRSDGLPLQFVGGQFITFLLPNAAGMLVHRSYSIASMPSHPYQIEIAIAPVQGGLATEILFNLSVGDEILANGPKGSFILKPAEQPNDYLLVGTNTGITPYRSMLSSLSDLLSISPHLNVKVLLGVRYVKDLIYTQDFLVMQEQYPHFTFFACLSREEQPQATYQRKGYVQDLFPSLDLDPTRTIAYLCGNPNMVDASLLQLEKMGLGREQIRREKYASKKKLHQPS